MPHLKLTRKELLVRAGGIILCPVFIAYSLIPYHAGRAAALSRKAPWWYILPGWTGLYILGWEDAGHEGKPRKLATDNE